MKEKKHKCKKLLMMVVLFLGFVFVFIIIHWHKAELQVHFLDIGQGDAIFIEYDSFQILVDGGKDNLVLERLREIMPIGDNHIDWVILSHPDADHLGGLLDIANSYSIGRVLMPQATKDTQLYKAWETIINEKSIPINYVQEKFDFIYDENFQLHFLHPSSQTAHSKLDPNNLSIVFHLQFKEVDWLFPGDIEFEVEEELVKIYGQLDIEVLKSPHHGSKSSSTPEFLEMTQPEIVVIQSGKDNTFGHPHQRVLYRYEQLGAKILRADQLGTISLGSDGSNIWYLKPWMPFFPQLVGFKKETLYNGDN